MKFSSFDNTKSLIAQKKIWAQRFFGNPKIPEEIAGTEIDLHSSLFAILSVFEMAL